MIGDHSLITMTLVKGLKPDSSKSYRRDWRKYNKALLLQEISKANLSMNIGDVQSMWNKIVNVLIISIGLSAAFDLVNIDLLMKRLSIIGLPRDVLSLIKLWLMKRSFYVSIDVVNSLVVDLETGTIQGSIVFRLWLIKFVCVE